jgi:hypothetical protein
VSSSPRQPATAEPIWIFIRNVRFGFSAPVSSTSLLFGRSPLPNVRKRNDLTDVERLHDIEQKLRCWGYLSHYSDAERDMAWLLEKLAQREAHITKLEARLRQAEWASSLP